MPALRIASRDARRHNGRTALVVVMIMLPVIVGAIALTAVTSGRPTDETYVQMNLGDTAQAQLLQARCAGPVLQNVRGERPWSVCQADVQTEPDVEARADAGFDAGPDRREPTQADLVAALGDVELVRSLTGGVQASTGDRSRQIWVDEVDVSRVPGVFTAGRGRLPERPGEVALTEDHADSLDVEIGHTITVKVEPAQGADADPGTDAKPRHDVVTAEAAVVGVLAEEWLSPGSVAYPGTVPGLASYAEPGPSPHSWFVRGDPVSWEQVLALNDLGMRVISRSVIEDPPDPAEMPLTGHETGRGTDLQSIGIVGAVVGVGLLEVILLVGPAFTVGARRSSRQLAILAATGGTPRDMRRVVLASGLVLGLLAGVLGAMVGVLLALAFNAVMVARGELVVPNIVIPWLLLIALVGFAVVLGAVAALLPARRAAKDDVVATLAGRRREARQHRAVPWVGVGLAALGLAVASYGAYGATVGTDGYGASTTHTAALLAGAVLLEIGIIVAAGGIVTLIAKLAPRFPAAIRLALRDAGRQRGRTAPALAAVVAAVAGMAAVSVYVTSEAGYREAIYRPSLAEGTLEIGLTSLDGANEDRSADLAAAADAVGKVLPIADQASVSVGVPVGDLPDQLLTSIRAQPSPGNACPLAGLGRRPTEQEHADALDDPRCGRLAENSRRRAWAGPHTYVDDGTATALVGLPGADKAAAALADGKAVVNDRYAVWSDGNARITFETSDGKSAETTETIEVAAESVEWSRTQYSVILPPAAAAELGMESKVVGMILVPDEPASDADVAAARAAAESVSGDIDVAVESSPVVETSIDMLVLLAGATLLGVVATWISVGLAAAESRSDLATLAAIGASPAMRRWVAGGQAAVLAVTGVLLGVATGIVMGAVFVDFSAGSSGIDPRFGVSVPWLLLGATIIVIPALAVLGAMAAAPSRLPLVRRLAQ
ncbi:ABC transporter permease [Georgenia halophila]|uniref:ABC transporter permease n=1 Tax=Georgenia halophila TaxID=620889 RepID=UPI0031E79042